MKKGILILTITLFMYTTTVYASINDETEDNTNIEKIQQEVLETSSSIENVEELEITSRIALIYDRASGRIIYEKNGNKQTPMASTTKIMTALVALENSNLKDVVTITSKAAGTGGSRLGLKKDDKITVNDLLYGLMLRSGNDAAVALAIHIGGSIEGFAEMMNQKAEELNLQNTHFVVPHGLDNEGHYTTAYELAKITDYALKNNDFKKIVSTTTTSININGIPKTITNTNKLLGKISGVYGVKTGFTNGAGRCLVTACKRDDIDIITVIIGADTNEVRSADTIKLIEYTYKNFELINIKEIINKKFEEWRRINQGRIFVEKGTQNIMELYLEEIVFENMLINKNDINDIDIKVNTIYYLEAPVSKNLILGNIDVLVSEESILTIKMYNGIRIEKKDISDYFKDFIDILYSVNIV